MTRPKGPSPDSVKRIYSTLCRGPKYYEEIVEESGLNRNTVGTTLEDLVQMGMLAKTKKGRFSIYEIVKTHFPQFKWASEIGWEIPWIALMEIKEEKEDHIGRIVARMRREKFKSESDARVTAFRRDIYERLIQNEGNEALISVFEKNHIPITPRILYKNLIVPYCLDCSAKNKQPCESVFLKETGEFVCKECASVIKTEVATEPCQTASSTKTTESRASHGKGKSEQYKRIEELLRKYG